MANMNRNTVSLYLLMMLLGFCWPIKSYTQQGGEETGIPHQVKYLQNRSPLMERPYLNLPLGSISPKGWIKDQLERMKNGLTGHLDEIYPEVMGKRNGWLGGDGDGWERGPYWIDGLLPLAYILKDEHLIAKVQEWVDWTLENQMEDGYLGPIPFESPPEPEPGLQRGMRRDWWPKMVMLKVLQQYYEATEDNRVIKALTAYFKYQLQELPQTPLDHWSFWGNRRGGDNLQVVYWLYNITGDSFLLDLGAVISEQTFPWTRVFLNPENTDEPSNPWSFFEVKRYPFDSTEINNISIANIGGIHTVNLAQGLKLPAVQYQFDQDTLHLTAIRKALSNLKKYHGQPQGMYGADEPLHGKDPTKGVEFCSISEGMYSLETILAITGEMGYADQLEKITYNALPAQASDDFGYRQYFQAANQVYLTDKINSSFQSHSHKGTDFVFGTLTGYPCCTANMHQSWPKFVQNLWYATPDGGVAALLYAPSEVTLKVAGGAKLTILEETGYPFREQVKFTLTLNQSATFPFHLRIPEWSQDAKITINGQEWDGEVVNQVAKVNRNWENGDQILLNLPMTIKTSNWYAFTKSIERGPLIYALKIRGIENIKDRKDAYGPFKEYHPEEEWNFALLQKELDHPEQHIRVVEKNWEGEFPWNLDNAPIALKMTGAIYEDWKPVNDVPVLPGFWGKHIADKNLHKEITLVPYGCTILRITEFPIVGD
jgi:uncharacterized protein